MKIKRILIVIILIILAIIGMVTYSTIENKEVLGGAQGNFVDSTSITPINCEGKINLVKIETVVQSGEMIADSNGYHVGNSIQESIDNNYFKIVEDNTSKLKVKVVGSKRKEVKSYSIENGVESKKYIWLPKGEYSISIEGSGFRGLYYNNIMVYKLF